MLKMLCAVRLRLLLDAVMGGGRRRRSRGMAVVYAALLIYMVVVLSGMFALGFSVLLPLADMGLGWLYFALAGIAAVVLAAGGTILMAQSQLYDARDNELLLSLPIAPGVILASRTIVLFAMDLLTVLVVLLPAGAVYWRGRTGGALGLLTLVPGLLAVSLLALALGCLFGWLIGLLTARLRRRNLMTVLLSLALLAAYFYGYFRMNALLQGILLSGTFLAERVRLFLWPFYALGMGLSGDWGLMVAFLAVAAAVTALVLWLLAKTFVAIVTARRPGARAKYSSRDIRTTSVGKALVNKELTRFFACPIYLLNSGLGVLMTVVAGAAVLIKRELLFALAAQMEAGDLLPFFACAGLCVLGSTVMITAPSVSLEGRYLWVIRSLPVPSQAVLRAKLWAHMVISTPAFLLCGGMLWWAAGASFSMGILILTVPLLYLFCSGAFGLVINLLLPRMEWVSETEPVKQGASVIVAMLGNITLAAAVAIPYPMWLKSVVAPELYLGVWGLVLALAGGGFLRWLDKEGARRFEIL